MIDLEIRIYHQLTQEAADIRTAVFVEEQGFRNEFDETDSHCTHFVAFEHEEPAATCRVYCSEKKGTYMLGRVAVLKKYRGKKIGEALVHCAEEHVRTLGGVKMMLSAQVRAKGFYEKMGYAETGKAYMDEDCPHIMMKKEI